MEAVIIVGAVEVEVAEGEMGNVIVELGERVLKHESPLLLLPLTVMSGLVLASLFPVKF